jgi:pimeloyl-ACP methyl ester carboxylesterase
VRPFVVTALALDHLLAEKLRALLVRGKPRDLKRFILDVIQEPTLVAGLSSGGVLAIWLATNAPEDVLAIIAEDPPIFSSTWPRIQEEKSLARTFRLAVDILCEDEPWKPDVEQYMSEMGAPVDGESELPRIPPFIIKAVFFMARLNRTVRSNHPYNVPCLPFNLRAGHKFLSEYDTDFSRATLDGDLSEGLSPEETLKQVNCPMLLLRGDTHRHETWGLIGAIDDYDLERIVSLVDEVPCVEISGGHEIHMVQPRRYIDEVNAFVDDLRDESKLPLEVRSQ